MHIVTTLDPVSLNEVQVINPRLHLRDGNLEIYFESQENLEIYRDLHVERPGLDLSYNLDNPVDDCGTDWN